MVLDKRYCIEYDNGDIRCFRDDGFWYTDKGIIIKWIILGVFFAVFMLWFVGGYIHAKQRLKKGLPLLGYHRFLISYSERKRHGQVPQNHFTFYAQPQGYYAPGQQPHPQPGGAPYAEPPPMYNGEAPPGYFAPQGASKVNPNQQGMEMPQYGAPQGAVYGAPPPQGPAYAAPPQGAQQSGVVGSDVEQGQSQQLPPRPQQAKAALRGMVDRFRR